MNKKIMLFFLLLIVAGSCLYGQKRVTNLLPLATVKDTNLSDVQPTDTISGIEFATRVDSLYKYLAKEPNSKWDILFKDGIRKFDLHTGDLLRVTYDDGAVKYYFLKLNNYIPNNNALLGSITWPDMPIYFKGEMAQSYGWHGDTIPSFDSLTMNYVLILPKAYQKIPALTFSRSDLNANVRVTRAVSLEGSIAERTITFTVIAEDSIVKNVYSVLLKKEQDTLGISQKPMVTSRFYKVSEGNSLKETIQGITVGTTVAEFFAKITKASELQLLKVISAVNGSELAETDLISLGDTMTVLSADKMNTTKYILEVTARGLSANFLLTSSVYTISVTGSTGVISGFPVNTTLKKVLEEVTVPSGASLTVVDQNDAYKPLVLLSYDTVYVHAKASSAVYIEVIGEDGVSKLLYQLLPDSRSSDAYVTSDLYSIDQDNIGIYPFRQGTSVASLLRDVTPVRGATLQVMDKEGFVRSTGSIYKDDKLVVISEDKTTNKVYYFKTWDYVQIPYLTFVISDEYLIDQVRQMIMGVPEGTDIAELKSKLIPAKGASVKVMDATGNESTRATLKTGDYVLVTSEDATQKAIYRFSQNWDEVTVAEDYLTIRMFPNPTEGRVEVQGLQKRNRVRVFTPSGMVLQDRLADSPDQTISLDAYPAGIYLVEVSRDNKPISIQKIVKQ